MSDEPALVAELEGQRLTVKVSRRLRFEIFRRDGYRCRYCGATAPDVPLRVDHVIPVALGGRTEPSNLVTACKDCNSGKSATAPDQAIVDDVSEDQVRWGHAMATAIERRAERLAGDREWVKWFDGVWSTWHITGTSEPLARPADWQQSVLRFRAAGLTDQDLAEAVSTTMGNEKLTHENRWRYFCGICWRIIDQLMEDAKEHLGTDEESDGIEYASDAECVAYEKGRRAGAEYEQRFSGVAGTLLWRMAKRLAQRLGADTDDTAALFEAVNTGTDAVWQIYEHDMTPVDPRVLDAWDAVVDPVLVPLMAKYIPAAPAPLMAMAEEGHS